MSDQDSKCFKWADRLCRTKFRVGSDIGYAVVKLLNMTKGRERTELLRHIMTEYSKYELQFKPKRIDKMAKDVWKYHSQKLLPLYLDLLGVLICGGVPKEIVADYLLYRIRGLGIEEQIVLLGQLLVLITPYEYVPEEVYCFGETKKKGVLYFLSDHLPTVLRQVEMVSHRLGLSPQQYWLVVRRLIDGLSEEDAAMALMQINEETLDDNFPDEYPFEDYETDEKPIDLQEVAMGQDSILIQYTPREWKAVRCWLSASYGHHSRLRFQPILHQN